MPKQPQATLLASAALALALATGGLSPTVCFAAAQPARSLPVRPPSSFADIIARVAPAVVSIDVTRSAPASPYLPEGFPGLPFFFGFPSAPDGDEEPRTPPLARVSGSGFFIAPDGYIVTNNHVVENATKVTVRTNDGRELAARIIGRDPLTDLAVLKVSGSRFAFVTFETTARPRVGDWVVAMGNPFGLGGTASAGIVSADGRDIGEAYVDYLQIDAPINRGNSKQLIADGGIVRGYLGALVQNLTPEIAGSLGIPGRTGALVVETTPGGPAEAAGLQPGDAILTLNGQPLASSSDLTRRVAAAREGERLRLEVWRAGRRQSLDVRAARRPDDRTAPVPGGPAGVDSLGLRLRPLDAEARSLYRLPDDARGVVIESVSPGSDAAEKGLRAGDVIDRVGDRVVTTPSDIHAAIEAARNQGRPAVLIRVWRSGRSLFVPLKLATPDGR